MLVIYILCDISEKRSLLPSPRVDPGSSVLSCYSKVVICQCETAPYTLDAVKWQLCLMWSHLDISLMCTEVTGEGSRGQMLHRVWPAWQNFGTDIWYFESPLGKYRHWRPSISRTTTTHLVLKADKRQNSRSSKSCSLGCYDPKASTDEILHQQRTPTSQSKPHLLLPKNLQTSANTFKAAVPVILD